MTPAVVIADGFLWTRDTEGSILDGPGYPIEANIAKVRGRAAQVLTHVAANRRGINAVTQWLRDYLPDAELYQGYSFPMGEVFADVDTQESYDAGFAAGTEAAKGTKATPDAKKGKKQDTSVALDSPGGDQ